MEALINWDKYDDCIDACRCIHLNGKIIKVVGLIAEAQGLGMSIGSICSIKNDLGKEILAEVIGFKDNRVLIMPYGDTRGIRSGSRISLLNRSPKADVGDAFLGRIINGMGEPIDGLGPVEATKNYSLYGAPINPIQREPINKILDVGVASINSIITIGQGQRVAIMAGSGVGKSVLIGMMSRSTKADVTVIGLIGERGREVNGFIQDNLGEEGLKKAVIVAATSDSPPLVRMRGAYLATTIAEYFMDQGKNVLLIIDSITRFAMSSRDVGLAAGEPPTSRGYTPSFFAQIPVLLERAGNVKGKGSITGIYTVLVEGDDLNDPVGDAVRSIVDGHIVLSRKLANRGHYPSVDVLESVSRVMRDIVSSDHLSMREKFVNVMATYRDAEDMILIGAYADGTDSKIDDAKSKMHLINNFLKQELDKKVSYEIGLEQLQKIFGNTNN